MQIKLETNSLLSHAELDAHNTGNAKLYFLTTVTTLIAYTISQKAAFSRRAKGAKSVVPLWLAAEPDCGLCIQEPTDRVK
jgi:hypothetical protein